jgi:PQQ-like domain
MMWAMRWGGSWVFGVAAVALLTAGCGTDDTRTPGEDQSGDDRVVRWHAEHEGVDGMLATPDVLFVVGPFVVTAFDAATGSIVWQSEMEADTSGITPLALTDDLLVVAPAFEELQAFDAATGEPAEYSGSVPSDLYADFELPAGYSFADGALSLNGTTIWSQGSDLPPQVGPLDDRTIVNDFDAGLSVVTDRGEVLFHTEPGEPFYDESAVLVDREHAVAYTFTADGALWAIQST